MVWHETTIFAIFWVPKGKVLWAESASVQYLGQPGKNKNNMVWHKSLIFGIVWVSTGKVLWADLASVHYFGQLEKHKKLWFGTKQRFSFFFVFKGKVLWAELASVHYFRQPKNRNSMVWHKTAIFRIFLAAMYSGQNLPVYIILDDWKNTKNMVWHGTTIFGIFLVSKGKVLWAELASVHYFGQLKKKQKLHNSAQNRDFPNFLGF